MIPDPLTLIIPLKMDENGTIRISGTRVTLDTVIARHHQGDSPEAIHEGFDVLSVNDIYAVIAYYLAHQDEIDAYLQRQDEEAQRIRQEVEGNYTPEQKAFQKRIHDAIQAKRRSEAG